MTALRKIIHFSHDQRGTIAILWAVALVAVLGLVAATFEVGKMSSTHSELQSFVDNVAIAAAAELDGGADAITNSVAAANLISDKITFTTDTKTVSGPGDFTLVFHALLPDDDTDALGADITTNPGLAQYVEVIANPKAVGMTFLRTVNGLLGNPLGTDPQITATAVAGYTQAACDITPLMFCLPSGGGSVTDGHWGLDIGDMMLLRSGGGNGTAWGPGNFGFIDLDAFQDTSGVCADEGGNKLACLIAAQNGITQCILKRGFDTEPGQKEGITSAAFNVRFDIYQAVLNGKKGNKDFAPAPNVIKGVKPKGGSCIRGNSEDTTDTIALPRDTCFSTGCGGNNRFGDGDWDRPDYLNKNHDITTLGETPDRSGSDTHLPTLAADEAKAGSRYAMYLREIKWGQTNPYSKPIGDGPSTGAANILHPDLSESGLPQCSSATPGGPERRLIIAVGVDCENSPIPIKGRAKGVAPELYVQIFLTEPVGEDPQFNEDGSKKAPKFNIYEEVVSFPDPIGSGAGGTSGKFHDIVQLYR
ncbi:MAG: pilus assembly protein TadG-related protein [Paracoccaceae bacterium]